MQVLLVKRCLAYVAGLTCATLFTACLVNVSIAFVASNSKPQFRYAKGVRHCVAKEPLRKISEKLVTVLSPLGAVSTWRDFGFCNRSNSETLSNNIFGAL
jgi:hypothetical protein